MASRRSTSRRDFLGQSAGALLGAPLLSPSCLAGSPRRPGASERIRVGVIGTGVRGKYLIANMPAAARVVALCDCSSARMTQTLEAGEPYTRLLTPFRDGDARGCATHQDYRRMLDREKLDAVVIATPDHHHVLAAMLACRAGLDVYLEKPLSVTVAEGRALARAVERYGRVLQVGSQQRTMEMNRFGCEFVRRGGLGRISLVELPCYPGPLRYTGLPGEPIPGGLSWDLFQGPTERRPHHRKLWVKDEMEIDGLLWRGWDLWRSYSGHLMTNWGAHSVDMVQMALGMDESGPVEIWPITNVSAPALARQWKDRTPPPRGDVRSDPADHARFHPVVMRYASGVVLRFTPDVSEIVFHGERGRLRMRRNRFETDPPELVTNPPDPEVRRKWEGPGHVARPHLENWLESVRGRKTPNAPVEAGHRTVTVCHLANLARELGRKLRWDPAREVILDDVEASRLLDRPRRKGFELPALAADR